jgi:anti-sigma B factor antagonist
MDAKLSIDARDGSAPGHRVMVLAGPLVLNNIFDFQPAVRAETAPVLVLDLTAVSYVDSAGIGALVNVQVSRDRAGRKLALAGVSKRCREVLAITRVDNAFTFYDTVEQAEDTTKNVSA